MISKVIHYCWFGLNPKPQLVLTCIESWKKQCPDYEIIEWNESNYDFDTAPLYVRQAYQAKKWAFITDYVRLQLVYENGGIYLDTDIELLKSLDDLLHYTAFFGFEKDMYVATGLGFGAEKGCEILHDMMQDYQNIPFFRRDGSMDLTPCPKRNIQAFLKRGLVQDGSEQELEGGIHIFPKEFFCPKDYHTGELELTENTYSIHHFCASWHGKGEMLLEKKRNEYIQKYGVTEGQKKLKKWKKRHRILLIVMNNGLKGIFARLKGSLSGYRA